MHFLEAASLKDVVLDFFLQSAWDTMEAVLGSAASAMELERLAGKLAWSGSKLHGSGQLRELATHRLSCGSDWERRVSGAQACGCFLSGSSTRAEMLAGATLGW